MQKQAIPLSIPQAPLVGTGEGYFVMHNTHDNIIAKTNGIVVNVDCTRIIVYEVMQKQV
ncbi:MAG: hypothetical protein ACKESA_01600 [Candidatus Hodgkinia cicadicola]